MFNKFDEFNHLLNIEKFIEDFLNRIDEIMVLRNFSRAELAKRMKCTETYISKIMRREKPLTAETMADMAFYLDLDLEIVIKEKNNVREN